MICNTSNLSLIFKIVLRRVRILFGKSLCRFQTFCTSIRPRGTQSACHLPCHSPREFLPLSNRSCVRNGSAIKTSLVGHFLPLGSIFSVPNLRLLPMFYINGFHLLRSVPTILNFRAISVTVYIGVSEDLDPSS